MSTQLNFFEAMLETRQQWEMTHEGALKAAAILVELLQETPSGTVTFRDMVKRKLGIVGDQVPELMARDFADYVDQIHDERRRIKDIVEDLGEFILVVVDSLGRPAERGNGPDGFSLRGSAAGRKAEQAQFAMAAGKIRQIMQRLPEDKRKLLEPTMTHALAAGAEFIAPEVA